MDHKLSVLIGSEAEAFYCCFRSPHNSPMINTREPIKKQSWQETALHRPSCDAGNTSESTEGALLFSLSSQSCPAFSIPTAEADIDQRSKIIQPPL